MHNKNNTYRKSISVIILSAYFFISFYNILHFHSINYNNDVAYSEDFSSNKSYLNDISDPYLKCTFQTNFSLLHFSFISTSSTNFYNSFDEFLQSLKYSPKPLIIIKESNLLRAPPINS